MFLFDLRLSNGNVQLPLFFLCKLTCTEGIADFLSGTVCTLKNIFNLCQLSQSLSCTVYV